MELNLENQKNLNQKTFIQESRSIPKLFRLPDVEQITGLKKSMIYRLMREERFRITSYNVCYTKLLRVVISTQFQSLS